LFRYFFGVCSSIVCLVFNAILTKRRGFQRSNAAFLFLERVLFGFGFSFRGLVRLDISSVYCVVWISLFCNFLTLAPIFIGALLSPIIATPIFMRAARANYNPVLRNQE
jgi:hypothetical protein